MDNHRYRGYVYILIGLILFGCDSDNPSKTSLDSIPTVVTAAVTNITATGALCGGNITDDGGNAVTERGITWQENTNPAPNYFRTSDGVGSGTFTSVIAGLTEGKTYSVRAYATNSKGTGYGDAILFTALDPVTDIDGNVYAVVKIGDQIWMAENLKTTRYSNGDEVPEVTSSTNWNNLGTGARCGYENSTSNADTYGLLYTWFAVTDNRGLAPEGWHIPSDAEWRIMEEALGMTSTEANEIDWRGSIEGGKLKEIGNTHWVGINEGATNESRFTALPGGYRTDSGSFVGLGYTCYFWTPSPANVSNGWYRTLQGQHADIGRGYNYKGSGYSVRCIKD